MAEGHHLLAKTENNATSQNRKEKHIEKKRRRTDNKKEEETSLLEFTRQVVDLTFKNHSDPPSHFFTACHAAAGYPGVEQV
jgi:hypothetical protein